VRLRPGSSDWVKVEAARPTDAAFVCRLVEWAAAAHRAPPGAIPRPPAGS
jgi:hypothetical protein